MKTKVIFLTLLMLLVKVPSAWAFDITQFNRLIALLNILDKEKRQLVVQRAIKKSGEAIKANTHATLEIHRNVEELLRDVDEFAKIRGADGKGFNDVVTWIQISKEITHHVSSFINSPVLAGVDNIIQAGATGEKDAVYSADELYQYFFDMSSVESKIKTYADFEIGKMGGTEKILGFQTAMQKKKIATAMSYYKAADELYAQAITLSNAISDDKIGSPLQVTNEGLFRFGGLFGDNSDLNDPFSLLSEGGGGIFGIFDFLKDIFKDDKGNKFKIGGNWPVYGNVDDLDGLFDGFEGSNKGLRMTVGERINSQKTAIDMMTKVTELKEKADKLLEEALVKTPMQQAYEVNRMNNFLREAAAKMDIGM